MFHFSYRLLPTFTDEESYSKKTGCNWKVVAKVVLVLLILVGLVVPLVIFAIRANSPACTDGLKAQAACQNKTHHLEEQLSQAKKYYEQSQAQLNSCSQQVAQLVTSLKAEKTQVQELQAQMKKLVEKTQKLAKDLQEKEEQLRKQKEASDQNNTRNSCSSSVASGPLLLLSLGLAVVLPWGPISQAL
ncbi:bone marrow stromal antigen 2-like [Tenrec ecaudatus]|uniref:bone marrow stromal antigen 2-like n=1 Tax=Tenrec ecaudatus TaxID=94439 RepID=UPI003F5ACCA1